MKEGGRKVRIREAEGTMGSRLEGLPVRTQPATAGFEDRNGLQAKECGQPL